MRKRWYILAVLAGTLVAALVWTLPVGPRWRSGPAAGLLAGFSSDGTTLVTMQIQEFPGGPHPNPAVCRWDSATGALLARVELPCVDRRSTKALRTSPDGRLALVAEGVPFSDTVASFKAGHWFLHDAVTGQRLKPIPDVAFVDPEPFSPDGRWFYTYRGDRSGEFEQVHGIDFFSARTGERVLNLPKRDGLAAWGCIFAPNGETAAVFYKHAEEKVYEFRPTIQIVGLPSGRERHRSELPRRPWVRIDRWDGRLLRAVCSEPDSGRRKAYYFDTSQDPIDVGVEVPFYLESGKRAASSVAFTLDSSSCLAYASFFKPLPPPTGIAAWIDWLTDRLGISRAPATGIGMMVCLVDRTTGATRYEIPYPLRHPCTLTPDGRLLACTTDGDGVEVWDTEPPRRWPIALAAGAAAACGILGFGKWRWRRSQRKRDKQQG